MGSIPTEVLKKIFSLPRVVPCFPLLGLTPSGLFMGLSSTLIYTSELILCSTICVPSATRHNIHMYPYFLLGGTVASWLARSTPERALRVRALAGDVVLCSWARHFTLTVPLSTQVYKWVPANLMLGGNPAMD